MHDLLQVCPFTLKGFEESIVSQHNLPILQPPSSQNCPLSFYPALFEGDLSDAECNLCSLSIRFAGSGINNPTETASSSHHTSTQGTKVVVESIKDVENLALPVTWMQSSRARHESQKALEEVVKQKLDTMQLFHQADSVQSLG